MGIKLYYFPIAARAEPIRLVFVAGNVEFEDVRVPREQWAELKAKMPFGQMPAIEVDGVMIAQSAALLIYAAKVAGLYPEDPVQAALADQAVLFLEDMLQVLAPTFRMPDGEEKTKLRQELAAGALKDKLTMLSKLVEGKEYIAGGKLSHADIAVFCSLSNLKSGFLDGIPTTILDDFPALKEHRNRIASLDAISAYYADVDTQPRASYKADA